MRGRIVDGNGARRTLPLFALGVVTAAAVCCVAALLWRRRLATSVRSESTS